MLFFVSASDTAPVLEGMDEDMSFSLSPVLPEEESEEEESVPRPQPRRHVCQKKKEENLFFTNFTESGDVVLQGNKRRAVEQNSVPAPSEGSSVRMSLPLKARYGIHAWKRWALSLSEQPEDAKVKEASKPGNRPTNPASEIPNCVKELHKSSERLARL